MGSNTRTGSTPVAGTNLIYKVLLGSRNKTNSYHRGVEQLVARRAHNPEAEGSSPSPATMESMTVAKATVF